MQRLLVLVRHGQSEWNLRNLFTGWKDPGLTARGVAEARHTGGALRAAVWARGRKPGLYSMADVLGLK